MAQVSPFIEHVLRRAGFGASPAEREKFATYPYLMAVNALTGFDPRKTDVDDRIQTTGYVQIPGQRAFQPNTIIADARLRWLFRMVHSPAPLQEKMALFWHHHFATAYTKIAGDSNASLATRMMDAKPSDDPAGARGQIQLFRDHALGNFRDLLIEVAKDPAMLYWLDGRLNTRARPQENFGRELMELFTFGVEHYTEPDVYAAARVFTGWNLTTQRGAPFPYPAFTFNANQHDADAKDFTFPIYRDGSGRIPGRSGAAGMQDGIDLITALASHPETAKRLARRLWEWFVSETDAPDPGFVDQIANVYLQNDTNMKPVVRAVLLSPHFVDESRFHQRYAWPVEFVVRALKEVGYVGFSLDQAATPLVNMGQQLYEPPDVNGWALGSGWFSTGAMLARMNFAATLATNQRIELRNLATPSSSSPESLVDFVLGRLSVPATDPAVRSSLVEYVRAGGVWTGSQAQVENKAGGLFHLIVGSGQFQLV
jgi:uncharacterized protein (DUF1800 family)